MFATLTILLALASVWDIALHRIPNALVVGIAVTGLVAQLAGGGAAGFGSSALAIVVVGALAWPAWTRGWVGGGDLKLAAAAGASLGIARVPTYLLTSALAVGAVAVVCYGVSGRAARGDVRRNLGFAARGLRIAPPLTNEGGRTQVPAGVGFAFGAIYTLLTTGGL